ncbi:MAG: ABC transporter substrate-binding protein [Alcaligenaceae bacterium]|nr:ABC transporter substrate-binding protein [Alcaligenaceae bacterium]
MAAIAYAPSLLAKKPELTIYGPLVLPTLLLEVTAKRGQSTKIQPWQADVWRDVDVLRAGLANQSIDLSIVPSYVAANLSARGQNVKLVNIMTKGLLQFLGREDTLNSVGDLLGKTIVIPYKNDMPDLILQALCQKEGINFSELNIQYTATPPEALALFLHNKAELALLPEPLASLAIMRGQQSGQRIERVFDVQRAWEQASQTHTGIPQAGLLVSQGFYEQHQEFLSALHKDLTEALVWSQSHLEEAAKLGSRLIPAPAKAIETSLPYANLVVEPAKTIEDDILTFFNTLYELNPKIVGGKLPDNRLFA